MSARDQQLEREFAEEEQRRQELFGPERYSVRTRKQDEEERSKTRQPPPPPAEHVDWNELYQSVLDKENEGEETRRLLRSMALATHMIRSTVSPAPAEALYERLAQPPPEGVTPKPEEAGTQDPRYPNAPTWPVDPQAALKCPCCKTPMATASPEGKVKSIVERPFYLPCGHIVGDGCVNKWVINLRDNAKCPVCRHPLLTEQEAEAFRAYDRDMRLS